MQEREQASTPHRFVIVFTGSGYAADAMGHLVTRLEARGHHVALVSYGGLAAQAARTLAARGVRGIKAVVRTVTGKLSGDDPLGLGAEEHRDADAVVVTEPELFAATRVLSHKNTLRLGLMTDLAWDPAWADLEADALIVPHRVFRELLLRREWPEQALLTGGVPLPAAFARPLDVEAIRGRFHLDAAKGAILLVDAENVDELRLERLIFQLSLVDHRIQPIFHVGEDARASQVLRRAAGEYGVTARMFGRVDNLEEYYAASDLVLTEVVNARIYALLALDKPVLLIDADADVKPVAAFLHGEGAAIVVPDILRLGAELDTLLARADEMARMRQGAAQVVDQQGAERIVAALEEAVARAETLRAKPQPPAPEPTPPPTVGPFEVIGGSPAAPAGRGSSSGPQAQPSSGAQVFEGARAERLTRAEAKEELAALILMERDVEKRLGDTTRFVGQWERRLDLARSAGEQDLSREAERFLTSYRQEEEALLRELDRLRGQKDKLKRRVVPAGGRAVPEDPLDTEHVAQLERRFRAMELESDLGKLKDRVRDQFGED